MSLSWGDKALGFVQMFARRSRGQDFTVEQIKAAAAKNGIKAPADKRAWGGVMIQAKRLGVVRPSGQYALDPYGSPKTVWRA